MQNILKKILELNSTNEKKIIFIKKRETLFKAMYAAPVCGTGGKPSTWFPPGGLVEQSFFLLFVLVFCFFFVSLLSPIIFLFWLLLSFLSALLSFFTSILLCVLYMLNLAYHHFLFRLQIIFSKFRFLTFYFRFWSANKL